MLSSVPKATQLAVSKQPLGPCVRVFSHQGKECQWGEADMSDWAGTRERREAAQMVPLGIMPAGYGQWVPARSNGCRLLAAMRGPGSQVPPNITASGELPSAPRSWMIYSCWVKGLL